MKENNSIPFILIGLALIIGILGIVLDNGWMLIGFLVAIAIGNLLNERHQVTHWNKGICAKYDKPWEYVEAYYDGDGGKSHHIKCRDVDLYLNASFNPKRVKKICRLNAKKLLTNK